MKFKLNRLIEIEVSAIVEADSIEEAWENSKFIPFENWDVEHEQEDRLISYSIIK